MDVGFKTDKGARRTNNEDAFFVLKNDNLFIIADGVGGNKSGEIASRTAVNEVAQYVEENGISSEHVCEQLKKTVQYANYRVYDLAQKYIENRGMATTLIVACINDGKLYIANVGDSRAYIYREETLIQISEDHTYVNELVKAGVISRADARNHEEKNMITRAVGAESMVEPDIYEISLTSSDVILLCTDGLYGEVGSEVIEKVLSKDLSMSDTCNMLVDLANENGGRDNITVICVKLTGGGIDE